MATYQGNNAINLDHKEGLVLSVNGVATTQQQIADKVWRKKKLIELAAQCQTTDSIKDRYNKQKESVASVMLTCVQGYLFSLNLPGDIDSWERQEVLNYFTNNKVILNFFNVEIIDVEQSLSGQYSDEFFSRKSGTWANTLSRIKTCMEFGINPASLKYGKALRYDTVASLQQAKSQIEKDERAASREAAKQKLKVESLTTDEGKIIAIRESVTSVITDLFSNIHSIDGALHVVKEDSPMTKMLKSIATAGGMDIDEVSAALNKLRCQINDIVNEVIPDQAADDVIANADTDKTIANALASAAEKEALLKEVYNDGYQSGLDGLTKDENPCDDEDESEAWLNGWKQGMIDS